MFENDKNKIQQAWRESVVDFTHKLADYELNIQNIHTPFELCYEIVHKLDGFSGGLKDKSICVLNIEFIEILIYEFGITPGNITFITDNSIKERFIIGSERYKGVNVMRKDKSLLDIDLFDEKKKPRKFDVVLMNPPYQGDIKNNGDVKRRVIISSLWDIFVNKSLKLLKDKGYLCAIHPNQWRMSKSKFSDVGNNITSRQIHYLEIHNCNDGLRTFNAITRYDWYILENCPSYKISTVKDENGKITEIDLKDKILIPNYDFDMVEKLLAKKNQETVLFIHSNTSYKHDSDGVSPEKNEEFKYPCVKHLPKRQEIPSLYWSNSNKKGHFDVPKVMYGNQADIGKITIDYNGKYGLTQFVSALGGESKKELENIYKAITSDKFKSIMKTVQSGRVMFNNDFIRLLKRDFYEEFI